MLTTLYTVVYCEWWRFIGGSKRMTISVIHYGFARGRSTYRDPTTETWSFLTDRLKNHRITFYTPHCNGYFSNFFLLRIYTTAIIYAELWRQEHRSSFGRWWPRARKRIRNSPRPRSVSPGLFRPRRRIRKRSSVGDVRSRRRSACPR